MKHLNRSGGYIEVASKVFDGWLLDPVEVKQRCRYHESDPVDEQLKRLHYRAVRLCEEFTRRTILTRTFQYYDAQFDDSKIKIQKCPIQESGFKIEYLEDKIYKTVSPDIYTTLFSDNAFGIVELLYGEDWPSHDLHPKAIKYTFTCGYDNQQTSIPEWLKEGLLAHIAWLDTNPGDLSGKLNDLPASVKQIYATWCLRNQ